MGRQGTIPVASLKILKAVSDNPGITQTGIGEEVGLSFTSISRHFRSQPEYNFLDTLLVKEDGSDGRKKEVYVDDDYREEVEALVDAYEVIEGLKEE